jgi:putative membrane protein
MRVPFRIETDKVTRYTRWATPLMMIIVGIWVWGLGLIAALLYTLFLAWWLPRKQADALRYWLDDDTLFVEQGVYFLTRKAIPVDRITDIAMVQGPLMRRMGIWALRVHTAGTGGASPEATLLGAVQPELVRKEILAARNVTGAAPPTAA